MEAPGQVLDRNVILYEGGEGSPASALRQWSPQLDPAAVEYWGKDPDNRLAIYAPVRLNE